ncbi:MAG: 50S ribosomal protein L25 [Thermodesulfobacteriota bacterium]
MLQFDLGAKVRSSFGKGAMHRMRANNLTPAILYGVNTGNIPLELDTKAMTKTLVTIQDQNAVLNISIDGVEERPVRHVIVKEVQVDPVRDTLVHADLYEIDLQKPTTLSVPVEVAGKAKGVDMGGELSVSCHSVTLRGLILDFPDRIVADVSGLGIGDKMTCKELSFPASLTLVSNGDAPVAEVYSPTK